MPQISVIIPVYNGEETLGHCLEALNLSGFRDWECIVVDDGSTDNSERIALNYKVKVIQSPNPRCGPATGRNIGANVARGAILIFVDADVIVKPDTLEKVIKAFEDDEIGAIFGSYDDRPIAPNFLSQYRNLLHHFTHQNSQVEANTFWAGCGAIRKELFFSIGGFSSIYKFPSIEDIELGYRLRKQGIKIKLMKNLQVGHMKRWTFLDLLRTDIQKRAFPWTRLILRESAFINDMNTSLRQRVSTALSLLAFVSGLFGVFFPGFLIAGGFLLLSVLMLNRNFYQFLVQRKGVWFSIKTFPWHWFYFLYSGATFAAGFVIFRVEKILPP